MVSRMSNPAVVSPEDQGVTFVELFFDLVFVFAVTQVAHHAAHHLDSWTLFTTGVLFWLIWWSWTQFTWSLNAANTEHHGVRLATLISTGVAFVMAVSIGPALGDDALPFAIAYVALRMLGLVIYFRVASHDPDQQRGVKAFASASLIGLALVIVGALLPSDLRPWVWLGVVLLDVAAAAVAGRHGDWKLHAGHFAERHGLIVIIALGESLIIAGTRVHSQERTLSLLVVGVLAVGATCLLWWTYFGWVKDALEERLLETSNKDEVRMARDVYSLWHFPLICGIVCFAIGLDGIVTRDGHVTRTAALALGSGAALLVAATAGAIWRARGVILWPRLLVLAATVATLASIAPAGPALLLGILCASLIVVIVFEHIRCDSKRGA